MKILFNIGHPAHVLLFRYVIIKLRQDNEVIVTAKDKDITYSLLNNYNISYIPLGKPYKGMLAKLAGSSRFIVKIILIILIKRVDILVSQNSFYNLIASFITFKHCITLLTVDGDPLSRIYRYFPTQIITSDSFQKSIKNNHLKIKGIFVAAYINQNTFDLDSITPKDRFHKSQVFLRFVDWNAYDDFGKEGIDIAQKQRLIEVIRYNDKIPILSSESPDPNLNAESLKCPFTEFHEYLFNNVCCYIGDSGSVAAECGLLGIPAIYISDKKHGFLEDLERSYGLVKCFSIDDFSKALDYFVKEITSMKLMEKNYLKLYDFYENNINVSDFLYWYIIKFPKSQEILKDNPNYQLKFK